MCKNTTIAFKIASKQVTCVSIHDLGVNEEEKEDCVCGIPGNNMKPFVVVFWWLNNPRGAPKVVLFKPKTFFPAISRINKNKPFSFYMLQI